MSKKTVLEILAADYPQLYLDPDAADIQSYRQIVQRGIEPEVKTLAHFCGDDHDRLETAQTPAGSVRVVTLGNRRDFELVLRGLLAAKNGPLAAIPESQGAAMVTLFNWPRIHAYLAAFPPEEQAAQFKLFTSVKENYIDQLVVLSRGPYSHVDAASMGCEEERWLVLSDTIRRYHELTHVICRRMYPEKIDPIKDELIADAIGLYAAFGSFDPEKAKLFLGIRGETYIGGRLGNYTDMPEEYAGTICASLQRMKEIIDALPEAEPFDLIPELITSLESIKETV